MLFPRRRLLLEELPAPSGGLQQPQIKMLQLRATLSDEDNVIAKRGTRGGIGLFNPPSINAICLVIPEISRIGKRVKSSAYSKATSL